MEEQEIQEKMDKVKKDTKDIVDLNLAEELLNSNTLEFDFGDIDYRVTKPNFKQKQETNIKRIEKYHELLKDDKNLLEENLIKLYKIRDIDIEEMNNSIDVFNSKRQDLLLNLGKRIKEKKPKEELDKFRDEIKTINEKIQEVSMKKAILLDSSIESQLNVYVYTYLAYLITEKSIEGKDLDKGEKESKKWEKAWKSYDDFVNQDETLVNRTVWYTTIIAKNTLLSF